MPEKSYRGEALQIFLVSAALMTFEITLSRLFSVLMFFHLAFFVLAIALFGLGLGGLYAHFLRQWAAKDGREPAVLPYLPALAAASFLLALVALTVIPFNVSATEHHIPRMRWLFCSFLVAALPFFFGSMYMSLMFAARPQAANRLYFSDLVGAALGCVAAIPILQFAGGGAAPCIAAALAAVPMFIGARGKRLQIAVAAATLLVSLGATAYTYRNDVLAGRSLTLLDTEPVFAKWNFFSRITVQPHPTYRGWHPSYSYDGPVPEHMMLAQDGRAPSYMVKFDGDWDAVQYLKYDITSLPYRILQPQDAMVIGAGCGRDLLTAKAFGVPRVQGVELNPITTNDVMRDAFFDYSGRIYAMEGVDVATENARTFVSRETQQYDLIFSSLVDTQVGSGQGAFVLTENHLYTVEAFQQYYERLKPGGAFVTVGGTMGWSHEVFLRMAATLIAAMEEAGVEEPGRHLLMIERPPLNDYLSRGHAVFMFRDPITDAQLARAQASTEELGYELLWPSNDASVRWVPEMQQLVDPARREALFAATSRDTRPLYDSRPYLFYMFKPADFIPMLLNPYTDKYPMLTPNVRVFYLLIDIFVVALLSVLVLLLLPLVIFRRGELKGRTKLRATFLAYFLLLGAGYVLVELSLLEELFLYIGNPTLTFAGILGLMLAFTGLGSFIARRFANERLGRTLAVLALVSVLVQIGAISLVPPMIDAWQGTGLLFKFVTTALLIAGISIPMGMLFPSGLRLADHAGLDMTCWIWGMNGVGSVMGSVASTLLSMNLGVYATYGTGVACYVLAIAAAFALHRQIRPA